MGDFRKLAVWRKAQCLAVEVYRLSGRFPAEERFGLTQQVRRAVLSVSSNIAEGAGRGTEKVFHAFIRIARGSLHEVRSQIHLAVALGVVSSAAADPVQKIADELGRMLSGILRRQRS